MDNLSDCETCVFWMPFGDTCHPARGQFGWKNGKCKYYKKSPSFPQEDTQTKLEF